MMIVSSEWHRFIDNIRYETYIIFILHSVCNIDERLHCENNNIKW